MAYILDFLHTIEWALELLIKLAGWAFLSTLILIAIIASYCFLHVFVVEKVLGRQMK